MHFGRVLDAIRSIRLDATLRISARSNIVPNFIPSLDVVDDCEAEHNTAECGNDDRQEGLILVTHRPPRGTHRDNYSWHGYYGGITNEYKWVLRDGRREIVTKPYDRRSAMIVLRLCVVAVVV